MPDYVELEMALAQLMSQQEASGFRLIKKLLNVRVVSLTDETNELTEQAIMNRYLYVPGKVFTPSGTTKPRVTSPVLL